MKSLALLFIFSLTLPAQAQSQFRYEGYIENGGTPVTAAAQSFTVTLKKPGCADNLGLTPWSSGATITITNGEFNLVPQFSEALLSAAMDPNQLFGCAVGSASCKSNRIIDSRHRKNANKCQRKREDCEWQLQSKDL